MLQVTTPSVVPPHEVRHFFPTAASVGITPIPRREPKYPSPDTAPYYSSMADDSNWDFLVIPFDELCREDAEFLGIREEKPVYRMEADPDNDSNLCMEFWAMQGMKSGGILQYLEGGHCNQVSSMSFD